MKREECLVTDLRNGQDRVRLFTLRNQCTRLFAGHVDRYMWSRIRGLINRWAGVIRLGKDGPWRLPGKEDKWPKWDLIPSGTVKLSTTHWQKHVYLEFWQTLIDEWLHSSRISYAWRFPSCKDRCPKRMLNIENTTTFHDELWCREYMSKFSIRNSMYSRQVLLYCTDVVLYEMLCINQVVRASFLLPGMKWGVLPTSYMGTRSRPTVIIMHTKGRSLPQSQFDCLDNALTMLSHPRDSHSCCNNIL